MEKSKPSKPKLDIKFIEATPDDINTIKSLAEEIWRKHYTPIEGEEQVEYMLKMMYAPDVIKKDMASGLEYFLVSCKGEAIGYFGIKNESKKLYLSRIYIKDTYRGNNIGSKIISFISTLSASRSQDSIYLNVCRENHGSVAFYKDCGFEITAESSKEIGEGHTMNDYVMTKYLTGEQPK